MIDITEYKETGICEIDRIAMVKYWTLLHRILKYKDDYTLCECTPKGKIKSKVKISASDVNHLINELKLKEVRSDIYTYGSIYLSV